MLNHIPPAYYVSIVSSFVMVALAYFWRQERQEALETNSSNDRDTTTDADNCEKEEQASNTFEISATDECEFVPLVSEDEDKRIAEQIAPKTQYMELDQNNPGVRLF